MLELDIPGRGLWKLEVLLLDYNGTLALDGELLANVEDNLKLLAEIMEIHIITSDTFGTVKERCKNLPAQIKVLTSTGHTAEKANYLKQFASRQVVAIGNGANDAQMLEAATLGIAVLGPEGCSKQAILAADIIAGTIDEAFASLLNPQRLIATLRR